MKIFNMMIAAAAIILLGSCSTDDSLSKTDTETGRTMKISVAQAGFTGSDSTGTRATNDGLTTTFESGDHVGIYVTDGSGKVVTANQEITYDGTNWIIGDATTGTEATLEYHSAYHYFAYYPYNSKAPTDLTTAATTGEDFFGSYIKNFTPSTDQSTAADYSAQDLMVATGAVDGTSLSFGMTHQMALVEMDFTQIELWQSTGTSTGVSGLKYRFDSSYTPYNIGDGQYRMLVNPTKSVGFTGTTYSDLNASPKTWTIADATHTKSALKKYKLGSTSPSFYTCVPAVGSLYNSDGTCTNKMVDGKTPIGVVVSANSTNSTYCESGKGYGHGLVMALTDAHTGCYWGNYGTEESLDNKQTLAACYGDVSGLTNTKTIAEAHTLEANAETGTSYPAFYYAYVGYKATVPAPAASSGWFLPSMGQWWVAMEESVAKNGITSFGLTSLHNSSRGYYNNSTDQTNAYTSLNKLMSDYSSLTKTLLQNTTPYWSSSESDDGYGCYVSFSSSNSLLDYNSKDSPCYVRPFLAF